MVVYIPQPPNISISGLINNLVCTGIFAMVPQEYDLYNWPAPLFVEKHTNTVDIQMQWGMEATLLLFRCSNKIIFPPMFSACKIWWAFMITTIQIKIHNRKLNDSKLTGTLYTSKKLFNSDGIIRPQLARFMGPTWGPPGSCRPQMGPMLAPWTLLSGSAIT